MADWPWPNDTKEERHRRIIDTYRTALLRVDETACRDLDEQLAAFGQGWVSSSELVGNDELKTAKELADLYDLKPHNIHDWARRHPEQLPKHRKAGKVMFRVGDVHAFRAKR